MFDQRKNDILPIWWSRSITG